MKKQLFQAKTLLSDNFGLVLGVLIVLSLTGGYITYTTHVEPGTEIQEYEESSWSSTAQYTHQAEVRRPTTVFNEGQILQNRGSYFRNVSPLLNGTFYYQYTATAGGELQLETDHTLILRSVDGDEDETVEYWRIERPLNQSVHESVSPGERIHAPFHINVSSVAEEISRIEEELGGTPGEKEILVKSQVQASGTRNDIAVNDVWSYEKKIQTSGNVYTVETEGPYTESGEQIGTTTVVKSFGPLRTLGGPTLIVLPLLAVVGLGIARWRGALAVSEQEREWLSHAATHEEFEEWISTGTVSTELIPSRQIAVETLEGLVDIAIDSNRRVIQDPHRGQYLVLLEEIAYTYESPVPARKKDALGLVTGTDTTSESITQGAGGESSENGDSATLTAETVPAEDESVKSSEQQTIRNPDQNGDSPVQGDTKENTADDQRRAEGGSENGQERKGD